MKFVDRLGNEIHNGDEIIYIDWSSYKLYTKLCNGIVTDKAISAAQIPRLQIDNNFKNINIIKKNNDEYEFDVQIVKKQAAVIPDRIVIKTVKSQSEEIKIDETNFLPIFLRNFKRAIDKKFRTFSVGRMKFKFNYSRINFYCSTVLPSTYRNLILTSQEFQQIANQHNIKLR